MTIHDDRLYATIVENARDAVVYSDREGFSSGCGISALSGF